ncbi:MAG TPA: alkaline phosphatase family protein, partial [Polyangiales bacterium]
MRVRTLIVVLLLAIAGAWSFVGPEPARAVRLETAAGGGTSEATPPGAAMEEAPDASAEDDGERAQGNFGKVADRVVLVSLDGLRPDAIGPQTRALHRLYLQGASPHVARTIRKSATLPSHASMVSGVDITEHGLNFNSFKPERGHILRPTVFSVVHNAGLPSSMFAGKTKLKHRLGNTSDATVTMGGMRCQVRVDRAVEARREQRNGLIFLHFA